MSHFRNKIPKTDFTYVIYFVELFNNNNSIVSNLNHVRTQWNPNFYCVVVRYIGRMKRRHMPPSSGDTVALYGRNWFIYFIGDLALYDVLL